MKAALRTALFVLFCIAGPPAAGAGELSGLFGGPFGLTDHDGRRVTDRDFLGRHLLVYFGYSYCPDICPTDLAVMATALDALGPLAGRVQPVLITVDPERDRPAQLKDFVAAFRPDLIGLTGSEAEIAAAARAYRVHRRKFVIEGRPADDYLVDHSTLTYLMGPDGKFVTLFPRGTTPERMAEVLRGYLGR